MIVDAVEHVSQISLRIDAVHLGCLDDCHGARQGLRSGVGASKKPVLSSDSYCPFILPMSGRNWKFTTAGIPCLAARFVFVRCMIAPMAAMSGCSFAAVW
jgi:hypothetical protein